jgi:hypothetical protein
VIKKDFTEIANIMNTIREKMVCPKIEIVFTELFMGREQSIFVKARGRGT